MAILNLKQDSEGEETVSILPTDGTLALRHKHSLLDTYHLATWFPVSTSKIFLCAHMCVCHYSLWLEYNLHHLLSPFLYLPSTLARSSGGQALDEEIPQEDAHPRNSKTRCKDLSGWGGEGRREGGRKGLCTRYLFPQELPTLYFETGPLLGPGAGKWAWIPSCLSHPAQDIEIL